MPELSTVKGKAKWDMSMLLTEVMKYKLHPSALLFMAFHVAASAKVDSVVIAGRFPPPVHRRIESINTITAAIIKIAVSATLM